MPGQGRGSHLPLGPRLADHVSHISDRRVEGVIGKMKAFSVLAVRELKFTTGCPLTEGRTCCRPPKQQQWRHHRGPTYLSRNGGTAKREDPVSAGAQDLLRTPSWPPPRRQQSGVTASATLEDCRPVWTSRTPSAQTRTPLALAVAADSSLEAGEERTGSVCRQAPERRFACVASRAASSSRSCGGWPAPAQAWHQQQHRSILQPQSELTRLQGSPKCVHTQAM